MPYVGEKYESVKSLDVAVIAKLIRADIKSAVNSGEIPRGKYSVKISRFAGGRSINVSISEVDFQILTFERICNLYNGFDDLSAGPRYSKESVELLNKIKAIVEAYNFDKSDIGQDYFFVSFYSSVRFDWQFESAARANIESSVRKSA